MAALEKGIHYRDKIQENRLPTWKKMEQIHGKVPRN